NVDDVVADSGGIENLDRINQLGDVELHAATTSRGEDQHVVNDNYIYGQLQPPIATEEEEEDVLVRVLRESALDAAVAAGLDRDSVELEDLADGSGFVFSDAGNKKVTAGRSRLLRDSSPGDVVVEGHVAAAAGVDPRPGAPSSSSSSSSLFAKLTNNSGDVKNPAAASTVPFGLNNSKNSFNPANQHASMMTDSVFSASPARPPLKSNLFKQREPKNCLKSRAVAPQIETLTDEQVKRQLKLQEKSPDVPKQIVAQCECQCTKIRFNTAAVEPKLHVCHCWFCRKHAGAAYALYLSPTRLTDEQMKLYHTEPYEKQTSEQRQAGRRAGGAVQSMATADKETGSSAGESMSIRSQLLRTPPLSTSRPGGGQPGGLVLPTSNFLSSSRGHNHNYTGTASGARQHQAQGDKVRFLHVGTYCAGLACEYQEKQVEDRPSSLNNGTTAAPPPREQEGDRQPPNVVPANIKTRTTSGDFSTPSAINIQCEEATSTPALVPT
ncbi:unnamed protein product, partial [Amoebophrya sp. A120]